MNLRSSIFSVSPAFAALLLLVGCGAEGPLVANTGGSAAGGSAAGGSAAGGSATGGLPMGGSAAGGSAGSGLGGSGGGGGTTAVAATASFGTLKNIIQMSCFGGLCHDLPEHPLQLKLDDKLYKTLTTHVTQDCGPLMKPGSPQDSALVKLLKGPCGETARMPLDKCSQDGDEACVTPANIALIEQWIASGAPQ
jgi:hypothetical protein